ncbi:MAG: protease modulator HflC [Clostridia bacterium]|nr:protease modulator HflC [Clostridia bacterium]
MSEQQISAEKKSRSASVGGRVLRIFIASAVILLLFWFGFTFRVREGECALLLRFGAPRREITEAGLNLRLPWPFESVITYDARLRYIESNYLETTTRDKRNVIIKSYVVWKIEDPTLFHNSVGSSGNVDSYIQDQIFSAANSVMGTYDLANLVSLESEQIKISEIQDVIEKTVADKCRTGFGVSVSEFGILRLSLPNINLESVFAQMKAERQKDIDTIIANATRDAEKIKSQADADAAGIRADGTTRAAEIRAEAEKEVAAVYAAAEEANLELYRFLRELDTVSASVGSGTVLIVDTDTYPFSVLKGYSSMLSNDGDAEDNTVRSDLQYILASLTDEERTALSEALIALIAASGSETSSGS